MSKKRKEQNDEPQLKSERLTEIKDNLERRIGFIRKELSKNNPNDVASNSALFYEKEKAENKVKRLIRSIENTKKREDKRLKLTTAPSSEMQDGKLKQVPLSTSAGNNTNNQVQSQPKTEDNSTGIPLYYNQLSKKTQNTTPPQSTTKPIKTEDNSTGVPYADKSNPPFVSAGNNTNNQVQSQPNKTTTEKIQNTTPPQSVTKPIKAEDDSTGVPYADKSNPPFVGAEQTTTEPSAEEKLNAEIALKNQQSLYFDNERLKKGVSLPDNSGNIGIANELAKLNTNQPFSEQTTDVNKSATFNPIDFINTQDYEMIRGVPTDVTMEDIYPGSEPTVKTAPARYFGYTPIFEGGSQLYPTGLRLKREKAIEDAIKAKKDKDKASFDMLKMVEGRPNYQNMINQKYSDDIITGYRALMNKYGRNKFVEMMNSPAEYPETMDLLLKYNKYKALAKATTDGDAIITSIYNDLKTNNRVLGVGESDVINRFLSGQMTENELLNFPNSVRTYQSLDSAMKDISEYILKEVNTEFEINVKDAAGKTIGTKDMYTKISGSLATPQRIKNIADVLMATGKIDPSIDINYAMAYVQRILPTIINKEIIQKSKGTNISVGSGNKPTTRPIVPQKTTLNINNKNGTFQINTDQGYGFNVNKISVSKADVYPYNTTSSINDQYLDDQFNVADTDNFINVNAVGLYRMPIDSNGYPTNEKLNKPTYGWFVAVQPSTIDGSSNDANESAYQKTKKGTGQSSGTTQSTILPTYFVPYDNIKSSLAESIIVDPTNNQVSQYVVSSENVLNPYGKQTLQPPPNPDALNQAVNKQ
jgi:hypothetical protein